jgi:hypothetical protein
MENIKAKKKIICVFMTPAFISHSNVITMVKLNGRFLSLLMLSWGGHITVALYQELVEIEQNKVLLFS